MSFEKKSFNYHQKLSLNSIKNLHNVRGIKIHIIFAKTNDRL